MLIPVTVGKGAEDGEDGREGLVCGGEQGGAGMWARHDGQGISRYTGRIEWI